MNSKIGLGVIIAIIIAIAAAFGLMNPAEEQEDLKNVFCKGTAECFAGTVTEVIDGDTIKVEGASIRLALASAPELHEGGGIGAREFTLSFCPIGSQAIVDEDDGQTQGSFGRTIANVFCGERSLNAALLDTNRAQISVEFCDVSEFGTEDWAKRNGC